MLDSVTVTNDWENLLGKGVLLAVTTLTTFLLYNSVGKYSYSINYYKNSALEVIESIKLAIVVLSILVKAQFSKTSEGLFRSIVTCLSCFKNTPCTLWLGYIRLVYVKNPEDVQIILNNNNTLEKSTFYNFLKDTAGHGLVTGPVHKWRRNRRLLTPLFNTRNLKSYFDIFNTRSEELVQKLNEHADNGQYYNLWTPVSFGTYSMLFDVAFGLSTKCISDKEKEELCHTIVKLSKLYGMRFSTLWLHPDFMFNAYVAMKGYTKYFDFVYAKTMQILEEIKINMKNPELLRDKNSVSVVENLIRMNEEGTGYTNFKDIYFESNTILVAGSETNALTICFTLLMLSIHPDIQEKVHREVMDVLGDEERKIEYDDVEKMSFMDQCINETLRMFPPLPFYARQSTETFTLSGGFSVPAGAHVLIPAIMVHRNPKLYENPDIWNPHNFSPEEVAKKHKYSFLAFSGGQRGCIGKIYAQLEIKVVIATILKNYRLSNDAKLEDVKLRFDIALRSAKGYGVKLYSRNNEATN